MPHSEPPLEGPVMLVQLRVRYTFGVWSPSWANVRHDGDVSSIMIIPARTRMTDVF